MPSALFVSPHLDDVAFSCCATLLRLARAGYSVRLVTIFTASVQSPKGFALACQTDKGIAPDADYLKLRRAEDANFCRIVEVEDFAHYSFPEAPHRGYESASELFAGEKPGDEVWRDVADTLREEGAPDLVFAPQGLGNHVDHLQTIRACLDVFPTRNLRFYRDTPYALREPDARPSSLLPSDLRSEIVPFGDADLFLKVAGCCAYESQIEFQFGGPMEVARKLTAFHREEAQSVGIEAFAERLLAPPTP